MANPTLTLQQETLSGVAPNFVAATAGGDSFANDGNTSLRVKNGSASPITVTINSPTQCNMGFTHNVAVTVAAGAEQDIGPFPPSRFNDQYGNVNVTYSASASVTVAAVQAG